MDQGDIRHENDAALLLESLYRFVHDEQDGGINASHSQSPPNPNLSQYIPGTFMVSDVLQLLIY